METHLCTKVSEQIKADIRRGRFKDDSRLPGYRVLASYYNVSDGTARKALGMLERSLVLQRRNRSGTYISPLFLKHNHQETRTLVFAFPEKSISNHRLQHENWCIATEIFQGLVYGANEYNAKVEFMYMHETENKMILEQQVKSVSHAYCVFTLDHILSPLRTMLSSQGKKVLCIKTSGTRNGNNSLQIGRNISLTSQVIADYITATGYSKVDIIGYAQDPSELNEATKEKIFSIQNTINIPSRYFRWEGEKTCRKHLNNKDGKVIFCMNDNVLLDIYKYAYANGLTIGVDFDLFTLGSGLAYTNFFPQPSYFRVPFFELGTAAAQKCLTGSFEQDLNPVFVQGDTSKKIEGRD